MPKPTLGNIITAIPDPLLSDNFSFSFPSIPVGKRNPNGLLFQCKNTIKPGVTLGNIDIALFGHTVTYATNKTFSHEISTTYAENREMVIHQTVEEWIELIRGTQTQHGAPKEEHVRDGYLTVYNQAGAVVVVYRIINCWPSAIQDLNFDGTQSSALDTAITWRYDYYINQTTGVGAAVPTT
jgi:hypothetical protein